ncbi:MAG: hypothetical protein IKF79_09905 [Methanosphaera sp.]|nr:hypothetical protein [Methanosphaera sp.]
MIKPLQAMLYILQGKIILNDSTDVRIVKREYPIDKTPCITIETSTTSTQKHVIDKDCKLLPDHPQYDSENPDRLVSQQVIREERNVSIDLHIWCDDEESRDEITTLISKLFYQVQSDYYKYCSNYHDGDCAYLKESCKVNNDSMRGVKLQCPKPSDYHYENVFTRFDIIRNTFDVAPAFDLDDLTTNPPVRRSIIRVSFSYYDYYTIGGAISQNLIINEELI